MKLKEIMDATTNRSVYNRVQRQYLFEYENLCHYCPPHRGCNRRFRKIDRNWKRYRKTQWKY